MTKEQIDTLMQEAGIVVVGEAVYKLCQLVAAAEREACAKVADAQLFNSQYLASNPPQSAAAWSIAKAIRARGEQ